jgi:hypothetical protein
MTPTERNLIFHEVPDLPGVRHADYRIPESGENLRILELAPNVFHVAAISLEDRSGETVLIKDVSRGPGEVDVGLLLELLLDYLTSPPKNCFTITVITQWPNGHISIESERHCGSGA